MNLRIAIILALISVIVALVPAIAIAASPIISIDSYAIDVNTTVIVPVEIINATEIAGGSANISFNPSIVNVEEVLPGDFGVPASNINNTAGFVSIAKSTATAVGKENASLAALSSRVFQKVLPR